MKTLIEVALHDIRALLSSERLRTVALYFPLTLSLLIFAAWPASYTLTGSGPRPLLLWCAIASTYLLGQVLLGAVAHIDTRQEGYLPQDWVRYAHASPLAVLAGKLAAGVVATLLWSVVATPFLVMAYQVTADPVRLGTLYVYWFFLGGALSAWGVVAACHLRNHDIRSWLLNGVWTALLFLPLLPFESAGTGVAAVVNRSPIRVIQRLVGPAAAVQPESWDALLLPQLLALLTGIALALAELRRWQSRPEAPWDKGH